jgi:hypothetical protein
VTADGTAASNGRDGVRHGPYLEVDRFALRGRAADHQRWRLAPTLTFETHVPTLDHDEDTRADEMGDRSWGLGARVGVRHEDGGTQGYGLLSVEVRFPAAVGAVIPRRGRASLR